MGKGEDYFHSTITDIYKSDNYWDQLTLISDNYWDKLTSMLMELCPDFNPHKYSKDVYSSLMGKGEDYLHSN